jgi:hypothetical protein
MSPYYNRNTRHAAVRGFEALSQETGKRIWDQILFHDDGKIGFGGTRTFGVGGGGGGKTTLETKFARRSFNIEGVSKKDFLNSISELEGSFSTFNEQEQDTALSDWIKSFGSGIHPETTLWRGREYDVWNSLLPQYTKRFYPEDVVKPLRVHVHKHSPLTFTETDPETEETHDIKRLDITLYENMDELVGNLIEGGNNVIYSPLRHYLSPRLKETINAKRNVTDKKNRRGYYVDRRYLAPEDKYLAIKDIFLFELFEYLFRENSEGSSKKFYTAVIDESHDLFEANAPDTYYWVIACMVDIIIDTRKLNLSLACMTHDRTLVDYRIYKRASHVIWLPGSEVGGKTVVDQRLVNGLITGQGVNESLMNGKIGGFTFNRLPKEIPFLTVHGLTTKKSLSYVMPKDEFGGIAEETE